MRQERSFRGISARLARHYLVSLGGDQIDEETVRGEGWKAGLETETVNVGPSLHLTEVTVRFEGTESALEEIVPAFARKAVRAGG